MLLDTLIDFFKLNESIMGNFIKACHSVLSLPDSKPHGILFDDVVGMMYSDTAMLIPEISSNILALKKLCLKYLLSILNSFKDNDKSFTVHLVSLAAMIEKTIENSEDKCLMALVLETADFIKSSVDDLFFIQELDRYLDDNLFEKYYREEAINLNGELNLSASRMFSVERWKLLRSVSLKSPTRTKSPQRTPFKNSPLPETMKYIQENNFEDPEHSSLQNSQFIIGNNIVDFNIQAVICDGRLAL